MQKDKGTFMHSRWPKAGGCYNADRVYCNARREGGTLLLQQHFRVLTQALLQLLFYWHCTNVSCQLLSRRDHNLNRQISEDGKWIQEGSPRPHSLQTLSTNRAPWSLLLMAEWAVLFVCWDPPTCKPAQQSPAPSGSNGTARNQVL